MIVQGFNLDMNLNNYKFWQIVGFTIGGLTTILNIWILYEFLLIPDPLDSNVADLYIAIIEMFYTVGFIMDSTEILVKVLTG